MCIFIYEKNTNKLVCGVVSGDEQGCKFRCHCASCSECGNLASNNAKLLSKTLQ